MIEREMVAAAGADPATLTIAALFERVSGQRIGSARLWRVDATLAPMLRDLGVVDLDALAAKLTLGGDPKLEQRVIDALLNHETSFFRDAAVLDTIADAVVARLAANPGRRLRLWSAGCSTGQEPLSLAMLLDERGVDPRAIDIVATDVSGDAVARAAAGNFTQFEIQRGLSMHRMIRWFDGEGATWTAKRALVHRVQFRRHNLVFDAPPAGQFDLILCRNVLLYFSADVRRAVFAALARSLRSDGLLVLGAGETVVGQTALFTTDAQWRGLYRHADPRA